jgi:hypothetical protein
MEISAIILARVLYFVEGLELNPTGRVYFPDLVSALIERCGFQKFPQEFKDFDDTKGVEFSEGKWGDTVIETLKIYNTGLQLDTRVSTQESERVLKEALNWAIKEFGIVYDPKMLSRKAYVSDLVFRTEVPILSSYTPFANLCERGQAAFATLSHDKSPWQPVIFTVQSEGVPRKPLNAAFSIQRRAETMFSENKYFSEAPLPTDIHVDLLKRFEADVTASLR